MFGSPCKLATDINRSNSIQYWPDGSKLVCKHTASPLSKMMTKVQYVGLSLVSVSKLVLYGWGLRTDRVYITLSLSLALPTSFNNNNNNPNQPHVII